MSSLSVNITRSVVALMLAASFAQAGEILKLNAGNVRPTEIQKKIASVYSKSNKQIEWIIQYKKSITEANKKALSQAGIEVFGYLPDDALVVRADSQKLHEFQSQHKEINAAIPYLSSYKINSDLGVTNLFNQNAGEAVIIKIFKVEEAATLARQIQTLSGEVVVQEVGGKIIAASLPRNLIPLVASLTGVEHIQARPEFESLHFNMDKDLVSPAQANVLVAGDYSDLSGYESGTKVMNFEAAWSHGFTGKNQIATMADTGLDSGDAANIHPDFQASVKTGLIFGLFSKSWSDPMGHGTHVAGSIAGRGAASKGALRGGAFNAQLVPEGMWSPMMKGLSVPSKIQDLFTKSYAEGARIHSNSWGAAKSFGVYDTMASQVDEFLFNNPDMLVLFAAGNSGVDRDKDGRIDANSIGTPGTAKNVLTVGASKNKVSTGGIQVPVSKLNSAKDNWPAEPIYSSGLSENDNGIAMFSSRGPTADGRTKPEIVAPGTNILSVHSQQTGAEALWGLYNNDYAWSGGTSMSTPLTAGAATVVRQILQEKWSMPSPSGAMMKAVLLHSADELFPGQFGEIGKSRGQELLTHRPNSDEGYGRVDVANIVNFGQSTVMIDNKQGVGQSADVVFPLSSLVSFNLVANLVWTDAPASANAAQALVNDLDLTLVTPDGRSISMNDHINNNELIEQMNLPAGAYKLVVRGAKVPQGKAGLQPFALIFSLK